MPNTDAAEPKDTRATRTDDGSRAPARGPRGRAARGGGCAAEPRAGSRGRAQGRRGEGGRESGEGRRAGGGGQREKTREKRSAGGRHERGRGRGGECGTKGERAREGEAGGGAGERHPSPRETPRPERKIRFEGRASRRSPPLPPSHAHAQRVIRTRGPEEGGDRSRSGRPDRIRSLSRSGSRVTAHATDYETRQIPRSCARLADSRARATRTNRALGAPARTSAPPSPPHRSHAPSSPAPLRLRHHPPPPPPSPHLPRPPAPLRPARSPSLARSRCRRDHCRRSRRAARRRFRSDFLPTTFATLASDANCELVTHR